MSDLGDALEIMQCVTRRFQSVRASLREWRDPAVDEDSRERLRAREEGQRVRPRPWPRPSPFEVRTRLWKAGVFTNLGRPTGETHPGPEMLLNPAEVLARIQLEALGQGTQGGRPSIHLQGHLRPHPVQVYMENIPIGADLYDVWIDAERGVMLRVEAKFKGRPIMLSEVTEIAYDDVSDEVFTFVPPPGVPVRTPDTSPASTLQVSLQEAARWAPFRVFTPGLISDEAHMSILLDAAREQPPMPASVTITYHMPSARRWLLVQESVMPDPVWARYRGGERIVRNGRDMYYFEHEGGRVLALGCEGTTVVFTSDFDRETLLQIADSLEAASSEPPRLTSVLRPGGHDND